MESATVLFERQHVYVGGVKVEYLTAGTGEPLVFFHGAGLIGGWDFTSAWASRYRLILPFHPGWGGSDDAPDMCSIQHFVDHYRDFLDQLGIDTFNLVGFSMGGWLSSVFSSQNSHRIKKLVLVSPAGLHSSEYPSCDLFRVAPEDVLSYLVHDMNSLAQYAAPDPESIAFQSELYREATSLAQLAWERMWDPALPLKLARIKVPTLLLWGEQDRTIPFGQAQTWVSAIDGAQLRSLTGVGHLPFIESSAGQKIVSDFLG